MEGKRAIYELFQVFYDILYPSYFISNCIWRGWSCTSGPLSANQSEAINIASTSIICAFATRIQSTLNHNPHPNFATGHNTMASAKPLTMLVARSRPAASLSAALRPLGPATTARAAAFSTTTLRHATPSGPPPAGFRLPRPERWDEGKESSLDKAGKYFLLTEMARGMYVVLEQYFRPPCVALPIEDP